MGCSPVRKSLPVVQIGIAESASQGEGLSATGRTGQSATGSPLGSPPLAVAKRKTTADAKRRRIDFHCSECGATRTAYPNFKHTCERGYVSYQLTRWAICGRCEHNDEGICSALVAREPTKPGAIEVGVKMPDVRCPIGEWERVRWNCDKCGSSCFDERGLTRCPVCHPPAKSKPETIRLPKFTDRPHVPSRPLAVVSIAIGQQAIELARITWPRMWQYADFVGADFVRITDDQCPDYRLANKFRIGRVAENYDRVLCLDADLWLMPDVGDLFRQFPAGAVWMHPDSVRMGPGHVDWMRGESAKMASEQGIEPAPSRCFNSGVVLHDGADAAIWSPPLEVIGNRHVAEQFWVEHQAQSAAKVEPLPSEYNCQWYWPDFRKRESTAKIIHLANCPHGERISRLERYSRRHNADFV